MREWLTTKQVSEELKIPRQDIYEAIYQGNLKALKDNGTRYLLQRSDVEDWLDRCYRFHHTRYAGDDLPEKDTILNERMSSLIAVVRGIRIWSPELWRDAIDELPERQRHILIRRYGLDGGDPAPLAELSEELDISRERVRQQQREAERSLKRVVFARPKK